MRSFQVFAAMTPDEAEAFFRRIKQKAPALFVQSVHSAAAAMKTRPAFMLKQPFAKQVSAVRRALSRVASNPVADQTLAVYFLEARKDLLIEWLDTAAIDHDDGALTEDAPGPPEDTALRESVERFRAVDDDVDRELLLRAFSAQSAIDWDVLDALVSERLPLPSGVPSGTPSGASPGAASGAAGRGAR